MMARTSLCFIVALWVSWAWAQPRGPADAAAEFVIGNCFRAIDDISRVKSMAKILNWQSLPADMLNAVKPVDALGYEAWRVTDEGQQYLVSVNTGTFQGTKAEVCSVVAHQPPDVLVPLILKALKTRLLRRDSAGVQITETYELQHPTEPRALLMITRAVANQPPVMFGFLGVR